ncbi:MAG: response regulator [Anaerolineales bacterium]
MFTADVPNILIVDDTPANIQLLAGILHKSGYQVRPTTSGAYALEAARSAPPDLILLDVRMPEMDGYEVCTQLKADPALADVPVIFISALDATDDKLRAFDVGGVDYITKPFRSAEVLARVATHLSLRQRQREIAQLQAEQISHLQQISQLKDEVLRMVSHDLKNPLGTIMAGSEFLRLLFDQQPALAEKGERYLNYIERGTEKMRRLINDVLDLAAAETDTSLRLEPVSLARYLEVNLEEVALQASEKNITLRLAAPNPDVTVHLAVNRFEHVLQNLLSNAIKYNEPGGWVELGGAQDGDRAVMWVSDNGIGIPEDALPHIFEKFYRVDRTSHRLQTGTGLGMAIVKAIVTQHHGTVVVESEVGVGSIFTVMIPLNGA